MTPDEWQQAREILQEAVRQPAADRRRAIAARCGTNVVLRQELEALLSSYDDEMSLDAFMQLHRGDLSTSELTRTAMNQSLPDPTPVSVRKARQWGQYTLLEEIGHGGFGIVYRAWDPSLKRDLALKVIDRQHTGGGDEDTWMREGQLLARVSHHNVVTVFAVERVGSQIGLAMELIKGRTLSNLIVQHGPLSAEEVTPIAIALCSALSAVHHVGLVHRDLKASNVMRASGGRIVLMDFGAGREASRGSHPATSVMGTPSYMAPEILDGGAASFSSDIYSLGVLLFYLVTGRYPVAGGSFLEVQRSHQRRQRFLLSDFRSEVPAAFVDIVEHALDPNVETRPATAGALRRQLEALPGSQRSRRRSQRVSPSKEVAQSNPQQTLQRIAVGLVAIFVLALAVGFVGLLQFNHLLGRPGAFGDEGLLTIAKLGTQSLIGPVVYLGLLFLIFNAALLLARMVAAILTPLRRVYDRLAALAVSSLQRVGLTDVNVLIRSLCAISLIAFAATLWSFRSLLNAVITPIDIAPRETISQLSRANTEITFAYRRLLELNFILLVIGVFGAVKLHRASLSRVALGARVSVCALSGLILLFMLGPWRVLFYPRFERATYDGVVCFVIGRDDPRGRSLLHCPPSEPPRNRIVPNSDPRLHFTGTYGEPFEAYSR